MKVIFTDAAATDIETIGDYIARDSPRRALTFTRELRIACEGLGPFPEAYPLVGRHEQQGIRRKPYGNYLIFYAVRPEGVMVERILNGSQDYEAILFPEV